jgi:hypothetical protein
MKTIENQTLRTLYISPAFRYLQVRSINVFEEHQVFCLLRIKEWLRLCDLNYLLTLELLSNKAPILV